MFAGAPEATIDLIHDLGNPARLHVADQRGDVEGGTRELEVRHRVAGIHRQHRDARNRGHPAASADLFARRGRRDQRARADAGSRRPLGEVTSRWLKLRHLKNSEKKRRAVRLQFPAGSGKRRRRLLPRRRGLDPFDPRDAQGARATTVGEIDATDAERLAETAGHVRRLFDGRRRFGAARSAIGSTICRTAHEALFYEVVGPAAVDDPGQGLCATATCWCCCKTCGAWKTSRPSTTSRRRLRRGSWPRTATRRAASTPTPWCTWARTAWSSGAAAKSGARPQAIIRSS